MFMAEPSVEGSHLGGGGGGVRGTCLRVCVIVLGAFGLGYCIVFFMNNYIFNMFLHHIC